MFEILGTEIERENLKELMEAISPWDCMYSPETLVDIYARSGPYSGRLATALGDDWMSEDLVYVTLQKIVSGRSEDDIEEETLLDAQIFADAHPPEFRSKDIYEPMLEDITEIDEDDYAPRL